MQTSFDYIICGAGASGLSLLLRIMNEPSLQSKKILLIDKAPKTANDRTWCFWEAGEGFFEPIVAHQWSRLRFLSNTYKADFSIAPYRYKIIRADQFYAFAFKQIAAYSNVTVKYGTVTSIHNDANSASIVCDGITYIANYFFSSIPPVLPPSSSSTIVLQQHFKGIEITTQQPVFDTASATFMDFTVSQQHGTTFMYVLPVHPQRALIEYTLFTEHLLAPHQYDAALADYLKNVLGIAAYETVHEEFGVIPMTNFKFPSYDGRVVYIGTAGGQTKASSGYTFQFIQKHTAQIVRLLKNNQAPIVSKDFHTQKGALYDATLLTVLHQKSYPGDAVFAAIFSKNTPQRVLRFLDNESSLLDDLHIMSSVPTGIFLPAALKNIFR